MGFPQTSQTLIQRLASKGEERDWHEFLADYWGPVCRFAMRGEQMTLEDAEDVAAQTFATLVQNQLLVRWASDRSAKLRTLLCTVVRNVRANRARINEGRVRLLREHGGRLDERGALPLVPSLDATKEEDDAFYAAWVDELLQQAVESLRASYHETGKGNYFRILYGRLCDGMTMAEVAQALRLTHRQVENSFGHARKSLAQGLEDLVRDHVRRYCPPEQVDEEFAAEWGRLGEYLKEHGGLEDAVRRAHEGAYPTAQKDSKIRAMNTTLMRLSEKQQPDVATEE